MWDVSAVKRRAVEEAEDRAQFLASLLLRVMARLEEPGRERDESYRDDQRLERALFSEYAKWTETAHLLRGRL